MSDYPRAERFAQALQDLEQSGDAGELTILFAASAGLSRPELERQAEPSQDVKGFWASYLAPFNEIRTEFTEMAEAGELAVLEWRSRGELATGRSIDYRGVSLLTFDAEDRVARFATYFDTAAFTREGR